MIDSPITYIEVIMCAEPLNRDDLANKTPSECYLLNLYRNS
jgi:hypothetical protein